MFSIFRVKQNQSTDPTRLEVLVRQKKVLLTPCKNLPGSYSTSYDDRFILEIAAAFDAAIISNDNFLDLWDKNSGKFQNSVAAILITRRNYLKRVLKL